MSTLAGPFTRFAAVIQRHRALAIAAAVAIVAVFAAFLPRLGFDNSTEAFFREGDETLATYERFKDLFETDEYSLLAEGSRLFLQLRRAF